MESLNINLYQVHYMNILDLNCLSHEQYTVNMLVCLRNRHGGSLIDSPPFTRWFESRSSRHLWELGRVLHSQLPVALHHETLTQYLCHRECL